MKYILRTILAFSPLLVFGQDNINDQIKEIRKRFYSLNNADLTNLKIGPYSYYLLGDKIKKVVHKTDSITSEYYFDLDFISDYSYFINTVAFQGPTQLQNGQ